MGSGTFTTVSKTLLSALWVKVMITAEEARSLGPDGNSGSKGKMSSHTEEKKTQKTNLSASHVMQVLKNLPTQEAQETWVQSLLQEDPLEKEVATHSNIIACETPWTEEPCGPGPWGSQRVRHD